jgi:hypothetical protein
MRSWRRERMRSSHKLFPSGATHGLPSDKLWVRNISMPTIVSICSSVVNRSINSWTGTLPLGSRKYSIRHSTTATVQDISCYLKLKFPAFEIRRPCLGRAIGRFSRYPFPEAKVHITNETTLGASFRLVERGRRLKVAFR